MARSPETEAALKAVVIYSGGLLYCSACAPAGMAVEEVEAEVNRQNPAGTSAGVARRRDFQGWRTEPVALLRRHPQTALPIGVLMPDAAASPNLPKGPKLWRLRLSSFVGVSIGATHTYARLDPGGVGPGGGDDFDDLAIERILTTEDAGRLRDRDSSFEWLSGMTTRGFDTRDEAVAAALAVFTALQDEGDSLVVDRHGCEDGDDLLAGPSGNEFQSASRFGHGTTHRTLTAVVRRSSSGMGVRSCGGLT